MRRIFEYQITEADVNMTVRQFLRAEGFSAHLCTQLKQHTGCIQIDREAVFLNHPLTPGERLTVLLEEWEAGEQIIPAALPCPIVYEDEDLLIINKPAGMPTHPSFGNHGNTLANAAAALFASRGEPFVYRCINRLDRDTSGLLILARHALSAAILSQEMRERRIHRTYQGLVCGHPAERGTIRLPIARKPGSIIERCVDEKNGVPAVTHYRILRYYSDFSLVEFRLETGRTHQIRVHMNAIGHPLLGDTLYHPEDDGRLARQALHSCALEFFHPIRRCSLSPESSPTENRQETCFARFPRKQKEAMRITAPLPPDLQSFLSHYS